MKKVFVKDIPLGKNFVTDDGLTYQKIEDDKVFNTKVCFGVWGGNGKTQFDPYELVTPKSEVTEAKGDRLEDLPIGQKFINRHNKNNVILVRGKIKTGTKYIYCRKFGSENKKRFLLNRNLIVNKCQ